MNLDIKPRVVGLFDPLELSRPNREIVFGLARGWSNREIAAHAQKTEGTVKLQISQLMAKSGLNRTGLAILGDRLLEAMAS